MNNNSFYEDSFDIYRDSKIITLIDFTIRFGYDIYFKDEDDMLLFQ